MTTPPAHSPTHTDASNANSEPETVSIQAHGIRARAIVLGLLLLPVNALWVVNMEFTRYSAHPTTVSLFFNCVFALLVLIGINKLVKIAKPTWAFSQAELLLIYSMLCIGSCMAGHDFAQVLVPGLAYPYAQSTPQHDYEKLFWRFLPDWAMVTDKDATYGFFHGKDTLYTREHIMAWLPATAVWTGFVVVLLWVMQCVNLLLRKQWTDNERLSYPLVKMPLELTASQAMGGALSTPLTKNKLFWIGFAVAATIDIFNSLNYYFPTVPSILAPSAGQPGFDFQRVFVDKPWHAVGWTPITFYPFVIGLGMLLPIDFLFSSWFFYILWKLEAVAVVAMAWDADPKMPYANYQALGAYILFFVSTIALSRPYFVQVVRRALGKKSEQDDTDEPLRYRWVFINIGLGMVLLGAFAMIIGMSWWVAPIFLFLYFAIALAITRMRAEMGTPVHDLHFTGPDWTLADLLGPKMLGPNNLAAFSMLFWFNRAYRCHPMPVQLEALKMAEQTGPRREMRVWVGALMLAGAVGFVSAFWAILHMTYIHGFPRFGSESWNRYESWLNVPKAPNGNVAIAVGVGFLFAAFLQVVRTTGIWWPFHPLAYAVSGSWEMNLLWFPLLLAWIVKTVLLRYGGVRLYGQALPLFYGLILGQFIPGSLLNIWGLLTDNLTYQFWQ
ncbi:MAG TPA: DUF6785 family protein [Capsulimonadaceae bacterium]|jgi:hypothetical protein